MEKTNIFKNCKIRIKSTLQKKVILLKNKVIKRVKKNSGEEIWLKNDKDYCMKILIVKEGYQGSTHKHVLKAESFFIVKGWLKLEMKGKTLFLNPGDWVHIPRNTYHRMTGLTHTEILECSTKHSDKDVYRKTKSGKVSE